VPYDYGPTGIMYRADKVNHITHSWNDMWSNPEAKGHIYLLSAIGDTLGMALLRNGYYCNSGVTAQVNKATSDLLKLKPWVASFTTNDAPPIASGDAWLMEGWGTPIYQGLLQAKDKHNIHFFIPKEGPLMACDTLSIGKNAKHPGTALLFMDWLLRPDNNAALAKYIILKTGTKAGNEAFGEIVKKYPEFNFSDKLIHNRKNWKVAPTGAKLQLWNQAWAKVTA
jgi:spermidine/putrescine transport system substrate-binding protein